ncbi:hypothetical protein JZ751_017144 [Albula glossodonta]|uniref:Tetratricopeptide repeat domain 9B n=1 Tax=Albula glossodonta TaxID=121402 RepID=A0A8T2NPZ3_9TELE|nr:hypothetical protein JZ751_017144 [Albula glossodonta]
MHSTLLQSSQGKQAFVSEQHGLLLSRALRDMEAKQQLKSLKSYPEAGGRSLAAAAGADGGGGGVGYRAGAAELEMEAKIQKAVDFKLEGHRCYKEKKFREAIGKYHRALLQLKGAHVAEGTTGSEVNLLNQAVVRLTEDQRRAVESTEIECYDSLTGKSLCVCMLAFMFDLRWLREPGEVLDQETSVSLFVPIERSEGGDEPRKIVSALGYLLAQGDSVTSHCQMYPRCLLVM